MDLENNDNNYEDDDGYLVSVGRQFRDQREADGIHLEAAAQELFIDAANLEAIENDNFAKIGSPVFIKGYVKNYARYLGLDVGQVIAMLDPHLLQMKSVDRRTVTFLDTDKKTRSELDYSKAHFNLKDRRKAVLWPYFLIIFLILAIAVFVGYRYLVEDRGASYQNLGIPVQSLPLEESLEQRSERVPEPQVDPSSEIESVQGRLIQQEIVAEEPVSVFGSFNKQEPPEPEEPKIPQLQANQRRLAFSFRGRSWLQIIGSSGKEIASRLFSANETVEFIVEVPAEIVMGNANQVEMQVNNEPFNHIAFTKGDVARFSVQ